eukprot:COSAG06_NODE_1217_length_10218_cov_129.446981_4_plen_208_part_00
MVCVRCAIAQGTRKYKRSAVPCDNCEALTAAEVRVCLQVRDEIGLIDDRTARGVNEHGIRLHHLERRCVNHAGGRLVEDGVEADDVPSFENVLDTVELGAGDLLAAVLGVHTADPASSIRHSRFQAQVSWVGAAAHKSLRAGGMNGSCSRRKIVEEVLELLVLVQVVIHNVHAVAGGDHPGKHGTDPPRTDNSQRATPQPLAQEEVW